MRKFDNLNLKIFTDNVEQEAIDQILRLMSIPVFNDSKVRIMPDVHAGAGCVIGFTANLGDKVIPNIVGVDISCGITVSKLSTNIIDFSKLDRTICEFIPSGREIREGNSFDIVSNTPKYKEIYIKSKELIQEMNCFRELKEHKRLYKSIGTLGGGNHFIEIDKSDKDESIYLVIHTGSRNLGKQVCDIYQLLAFKNLQGWDKLMEEQEKMIKEYKESGRKSELQEAIRNLHNSFKCRGGDIPRDLSYLEGKYRDSYLHDMKLCQEWSRLNKELISDIILDELGISCTERFETKHNYIDFESNITRKGAVDASKGVKLIIPINMRDGSLICIGKGNEDWNNSAPHGAGRIMSRSEAFKTLNIDDYINSMSGIHTISVGESTLDEAPMVYKPMNEIIGNISDTVDIIDIIKPIYNYKGSDQIKK